MTAELVNILKSRELRISYDKDAISVILEIKSQSTLLDANHAEKTKFKKINNMMK